MARESGGTVERVVFWIMALVSGFLLLAAQAFLGEHVKLTERVERLEREHGSLQARMDLVFQHRVERRDTR